MHDSYAYNLGGHHSELAWADDDAFENPAWWLRPSVYWRACVAVACVVALIVSWRLATHRADVATPRVNAEPLGSLTTAQIPTSSRGDARAAAPTHSVSARDAAVAAPAAPAIHATRTDYEQPAQFLVQPAPAPLYVPSFAQNPAGASVAPSSVLVGDTGGLVQPLQVKLERLARTLNQTLNIVSGFRTHAEQEALYERYLAGTGNLSAVPGTSRHESGRAADVYIGQLPLANYPGARAAAVTIGLAFPVSGEAWHTEIAAAAG